MTPDERRAWLEERRTGIGGSDAAIIMGVSPWKTPYALFYEKRGLRVEDAPTEAMEWGSRLEDVVAEHYAQKTGRTLLPGEKMVRAKGATHLFANTDRVIQGVGDHGVYEGKTSSRREDWENVSEPPIYYQTQVQHYMLVTDRTWASFGVLIGGRQFEWMDVARNDRYLDVYQRKAKEFWDRVQNDDPPPQTGHESERAILAALYPRQVGRVMDLPPSYLDLVEELEQIVERTRADKARKAEIETLIVGAMGDALYATLPDGTAFKLAEEKRKAHTKPAWSGRVLRKVKYATGV